MIQEAAGIPGQPHRWGQEIAAWAMGKLVQWRYVHADATDADWRDCPYPSNGMPNWWNQDIPVEFRIFPGQPKVAPQADPFNWNELSQYNPDKLLPQHRWTGEGPPPAKWSAPDGTLVYRSYVDYCED